jgi:hypothetical protein
MLMYYWSMLSSKELQAEKKLLIAIYSDQVFHGKTVKQELPRCCESSIDLYGVPVKFRDITLGSKTFTLLEPRCPLCGKWVRAEFSILN